MPRTLRLPLLLLAALTAALALFLLLSTRSVTVAQATGLSLTPTPVLDTDLSAEGGTFTKACHTALRPGTPGVATQRFNAGSGLTLVEVKLSGKSGDWDVAVFDGAGRSIASAASPDAQETASGWAAKGGELQVQACRRSGDAESVPVLVGVADVDDSPAAATEAKKNAPQAVHVKTPTRESKNDLAALGLDMTEHGGAESLGVILHGEDDEDKLRKAGLEWTVEIDDLVADDVAARRNEVRVAERSARAVSDLPSGREEYRVLADYEAELKKLAEENPSLVKLITLPEKTYGGKDVLGVEITENVQANDGKPAFFNMGVHHAREWPAGELTMEWALELVQGYKAGDARAVKVVKNSRNIVVPIVNPDGFEASRTAGGLTGGDGGRPEDVPDTAYIVAGAANGGEYRRKNCRLGTADAGNCTTSAGLAENGTDPNRNYGGLWGGPGADTNPATQTYRGPGPFSERETRNIQATVSRNQVMSLITNHTTAALFLRSPGLASLGDPVDENRGYKALGDEVAKETGYFSQKSFELYDTTGTTEDWSYNTTGGFGFTNEIYCGEPNYETGDCDDPAFHPTFPNVVNEWTGENPVADHAGDPGPNKDYDGGGNREGFYIAAESAMNEARHSVLEGTAPAGTTLRLKKEFKTATFPQADGKPILFDDKLETVYDVGASGAFRWHVNPSTRPIVAKDRGDKEGGDPSPAEKQEAGPEGYEGDPNNDGALVPAPQGGSGGSTSYNDHPIVVPNDGGDNRSANVRISWPTPASDYDVEIFEDVNGDGMSDSGDKSIGVSAQGATTEEEVGIQGSPKLDAGKKYVLRVVNFAAGEPYEVDITWNGPEPFQPAQVESYTLTCERGGAVVSTQQVTIDRGQVQAGMTPCSARQAGAGTGTGTGTTPGSSTTPPPSGTTPPTACAATAGFVKVAVTRRGRGATLGFTRRAQSPVTVRVFQQSRGRRVLGERLVASFSNRSSSVRWNGKANRGKRKVTDGYYFVRYTMKTGAGSDTRRVVLQRSRGRFTRRADFFRRGSCDLLPQFKLERPVFGGTGRPANLGISYKLARAGRVTVTVLRGSKVVKRFAARTVVANRTTRLRLTGRGLKRGQYRVRLSARATSGGAAVTSTLVSRKL